MSATATQLLWLAGLFGGVVVVAALVNWVAKKHRRRLRRIVVLYACCVAATCAGLGAKQFDAAWAHGMTVAGDTFAALTIVNAAGMLLFLVLLPVVSIRLPMIAGDLVVGLGYIVATIVVLSRNGLDPTSALATGAVVSAVLAISLQTTLGNILGGVALQLDGSIHEGDLIRLASGKSGRIQSIRWRHTLVDTGASTIVVPNSMLLANEITILGWRNERPFAQPASITFGVGFDVSPARVNKVVTEALASSAIDNLAPDSKPSCRCSDLLGPDGYAIFTVDYMVAEPIRADATASRVRERVYAALRRARITLAVPGRTNSVAVQDQSRTDRDREQQIAKHLDALHTVHLFHALTDQELRSLADGLMYVPFTAGETIMRQGAVAHSLFVITSGTAEVRARLDNDPLRSEVVATITAPDFFGEMGLLTGAPRTADVVAKTDVECYRLPQDAFEHVLLARPEIAKELSERLASRKVALDEAKEDLDEAARAARRVSERERIYDGIREFFGL